MSQPTRSIRASGAIRSRSAGATGRPRRPRPGWRGGGRSTSRPGRSTPTGATVAADRPHGRDLADDRLPVPARGPAPAQAALHPRPAAGARALRALPAAALGRGLPHRDGALAGDPGPGLRLFAHQRPALRRPAAPRGPTADRPATHGADQTARPAAPAGRVARPAPTRAAQRRAARLPHPAPCRRIPPSPPRPNSPTTSW